MDNLSSQWQHEPDTDAPESIDTAPFVTEVFPALALTATSNRKRIVLICWAQTEEILSKAGADVHFKKRSKPNMWAVWHVK